MTMGKWEADLDAKFTQVLEKSTSGECFADQVLLQKDQGSQYQEEL